MSGDKCRSCGSRSVVPVLDKRIERNPTGGGNKYRQYCTACEKWQPSTSAERFENHPEPHVLPVDGDPKDPETIIPLTAYDYGPELADLADQVEKRQRAVTDGGEPEAADPADTDDEEPENEFNCPECGEHQVGFPDECGHCGARYQW